MTISKIKIKRIKYVSFLISKLNLLEISYKVTFLIISYFKLFNCLIWFF